MRIENVRASVYKIFMMTGFDRFIAVNPIADDALKFDDVLNEFVGLEDSSAYVHVSLRKFLRDKATYSAEKIVVDSAGEKYSWRDIDRCANRIAADLAEKNICKGSHVAICGANSINWLLTFFAVQKPGAIAVLINFNLCAREIAAPVDYADVTHFCYGETSASIDELKNFCGEVQGFYSFGNEVDFKARPSVKSKLHQIIRDDDKACVMLPFFHIFGLVAGIFANALASTTIYLPEKIRSNLILDLIARERCTIFHSVPTMFLALIANKNFDAEKISSLRCSIISGAHTTAAQLENLQGLMPHNHFLSGYGLSEMAPVSITAYDDSRENILHTVGKPVKNIRIKIDNPNQNGVGEILVQGFNLMTGYYKLAPAEQAIDADGWLLGRARRKRLLAADGQD